MTSRELAINILYKIENAESYSNIEIDKEFTKTDMDPLDKALASELVYGVITWKITLDAIIKRYSSIKINKISDWILNILRIGIYQIVFLDKIPVSAAVNESVKLAKRYGHEASSRFTNAILRKIEKNELDKLLDYLSTQPILEDELISIITSHPLWLVDKLLTEHDKKFVTLLLNANNVKPCITLRANTLKTTRDELLKLLQLKGFECEVLDACSAPGGKTTYLAELMKNIGKIDAWDIHEHRVKLVKDLANKLDISIINATQKDASEYSPAFEKYYDKILLDVPCTGIGVIRKKPDIKWTRNPEDILTLVEVQEKILETCSKYLRNGGQMVYSTCTVFEEENHLQIEKFLSKHEDFKLIEEVKLYPHIDNTDGFYIALLERT